MNFRGKTNDPKEIEYITYVMRMAGVSEKQFVRAAVLSYCDHLMKRANELRAQYMQELLDRQQQAESERLNEQSVPSDVAGNPSESQALLPTDNSVLAQPESGVVNS